MNPAQLKKMMMEAQKMQLEIEKKQKKFEKQEFTKNIAGGIVLKMNGKKQILELKIEKNLLDPDDQEFLEDLLIKGFNELSKEIDDKENEILGSLTKGMPF